MLRGGVPCRINRIDASLKGTQTEGSADGDYRDFLEPFRRAAQARAFVGDDDRAFDQQRMFVHRRDTPRLGQPADYREPSSS